MARRVGKEGWCFVFSIAVFSAFVMGQAAAPAVAVDCGQPPVFQSELPPIDSATAEQLRIGRVDVRAHSKAVTDWITCMDTRSRKVFVWMTDEQRDRWDEDVNDAHNARVDLERGINERIRAYNARVERTRNAGS